jgi:hypothetical protein
LKNGRSIGVMSNIHTIAVNSYENVYVGNGSTIFLMKLTGTTYTTTTFKTGFSGVVCLAVDATGNVYAADAGANTIYKIPADGGPMLTVAAKFSNLTGVTVDNIGNVSAYEGYLHLTVKKFTPAGGYYINPALPVGLTMSPVTGIISGTPTVNSPAATYSIAAWNAAGLIETTVPVSVIAPLPIISYNGPQTYILGTAITALSPGNSGAPVSSYAISPALPAGLGFNTVTGAITGIPAIIKAVTAYTITAINASGSGTAIVNITVNVPAPVISYSGPQFYLQNTGVTPLSPVNTGGGGNQLYHQPCFACRPDL